MIQPTILIIDQNKENTSLIKNIFEDRYEAIFAYSSDHGLRLFKDLNMKIRVVLLSAEISNSNGIDVLLQIKKINSVPKIIIVADNKTLKTAVTVMKAGAFDYITLPFKKNLYFAL